MAHTSSLALASLALAALLAPLEARALTLYAEGAGGIAQFHNNDPFFGAGTDNPSGYGLGLDLATFVSLTGGSAPTEVQLGFQGKSSTGSQGALSYSILSFYPDLRIQFSRIYIGGGLTPWVFRGTSLGDGQIVHSALGYLGEAGFLFPVTPRFSFGLGGSAEWISVSGTSGPSPVLQVLGLMRVYWGVGSTGGTESGTSSEFRGWRYPFGFIR